jgi:hypothetical protein
MYYFYERCAASQEVDEFFSDVMDQSLKGNTSSPLLVDDSSVGMLSTTTNTAAAGGATADKKKAYAAIVDMTNVATSIANEMKETNRLARQSQLIQLAQHLGKADMLEDLLQDLKQSGGG